MTPEEAYQEALRRIREAEESGALELDLSRLSNLTLVPPELSRLTNVQTLRFNELSDLSPLAGMISLQSLYIYRCEQLSDLSPLAGMTSLQSLDLSWCGQLSDLSQLATMTSLKRLNLSECERLSDLSPLAGLTSLQQLSLDSVSYLTDLSPLAGLTSLEYLLFYDCSLLEGDLTPLGNLTFLNTLSLNGCSNLSGDLSPLAGLSSLQHLDLSFCWNLSDDLSPLTNLISLQKLSLHSWKQLSDLRPLTGLPSLHWLDLAYCERLSDLSPLVSLTSLRTLDIHGCGIRLFAPLESLLPGLADLRVFGCQFEDLPSEVCGESYDEYVLHKIHAHYEDLKSGPLQDAEVKVLFLGNGGVGKTQLCRRLRALPFDPSVPTTHGIRLGEMTVMLENFPEPVRLNLWDFGGQDIYHGSHALFLQAQALFLILWAPELEQSGSYEESGVLLRHRPLSYWLDYLRTFAGTDASVLIVQSQCDMARDRAPHPPAKVDDFCSLRWIEVSAKTGLRLNLVKAALEEAVRDCFERRPPPPIGAGRVKVRDELRQMLEEDQKHEPAQRQHRLLERAEFDRICNEVGGVSDKNALLDFLHHNGVVFYRPGLFGDRIILDQNWALEAVYSIFDRKKILPLLRGHGHFSRADLERLIWSDYTTEEQKVFLGMMESCGICFKVRELSDDEWEYIAPELLPEWSEAQKSLLTGRIPKGHPTAEVEARYAFLHEGVLRGYLSKIGRQAGDAAIYWKYGCWSYEETTDSRVLIESQWDNAESEAGAGSIRLRAWGENAETLLDPLLEALQKLPVGQPPEIKRTKAVSAHATSLSSTLLTVSTSSLARPPDIVEYAKQVDRPTQIKLEDLIFAPDPFMKDFFVSYTKTDKAWAEWIAWTLEATGYSTVLQAWDFLAGSNFVLEMQRAATEANRTIAVLSQKYLESSFTQPEWAAAFAQDPQGKKQKLIPVRIAPCELTGILASIVYLDLVDLPENDARTALLGAFTPVRNKPHVAPAFPGSRTPQAAGASPTQPAYPGATKTTSAPVAEILTSVAQNADQSRGLSPSQRLWFIRQLNAILPQQFNMLLFSVNPEPGLVPPMPAPQGDRTAALLTWAEAPGGCGLSVLQQLLETIVNPQ
jgi:internalin A